MRSERRTGPFPHSSHLSLTSQAVAVGGYGHRVPMTETNIGIGEVDEQIVISRRAAIDMLAL